jgi:hypothetical protein
LRGEVVAERLAMSAILRYPMRNERPWRAG